MGFSFEAVDALDFEELRPGYAPEAARWVVERDLPDIVEIRGSSDVDLFVRDPTAER